MPLTTVHYLSQMDVVDRNGEKIGRIRDVLLDPESGRCDYLLLGADTGPFALGGGGNLTPVPLTLLTWKENVLSLEAGRDIVQGAPSFAPRDVGRFSREYRDKLDRFWGVRREEAAPRREAVAGEERRRAFETPPHTEGEQDSGFQRPA